MNETIPYENSDDGEEGRGRCGTVTNDGVPSSCKTISTRSMRRDIRTGGDFHLDGAARDHDSRRAGADRKEDDDATPGHAGRPVGLDSSAQAATTISRVRSFSLQCARRFVFPPDAASRITSIHTSTGGTQAASLHAISVTMTVSPSSATRRPRIHPFTSAIFALFPAPSAGAAGSRSGPPPNPNQPMPAARARLRHPPRASRSSTRLEQRVFEKDVTIFVRAPRAAWIVHRGNPSTDLAPASTPRGARVLAHP